MKNAVRAALAACLLAGSARAAPPAPASAYVITPSSPNGSATFAPGQVPLWFDETDFSACAGGVVSATCLGTPKPPSQSKPLPVSGAFTGTVTSSGATPVSYASPGQATVATTSGTLFTAGTTYTKLVAYCTLPNATANVWVNLSGGTAAVNSGVSVPNGGGCLYIGTPAQPMPTPGTAVTAITDGASAQTLTVSGG